MRLNRDFLIKCCVAIFLIVTLTSYFLNMFILPDKESQEKRIKVIDVMETENGEWEMLTPTPVKMNGERIHLRVWRKK